MCHKKKIKCDGVDPCANCLRRNWSCRYNIEADLRRKTANREALEELNNVHEQIERTRELTAGIVAVLKVGTSAESERLIDNIRTSDSLSQLAEFVSAERRQQRNINSAAEEINVAMSTDLRRRSTDTIASDPDKVER
jgi:hypothetical protein